MSTDLKSSGSNGSLFGRYLRTLGPGYMQSAMTLGGGSAFAAHPQPSWQPRAAARITANARTSAGHASPLLSLSG